ncbi:MAG TPA: hypothetical protein VFE46_00195 [Pirellulales bacterium]|nr:hypothetical protein [Pirellulales bacterium]
MTRNFLNTRMGSFEQLENRSVPTSGLVGGLLGTLGSVYAAGNLGASGQVNAGAAGANVGAYTSAAANASAAGADIGVKVKINATANLTLPGVNSVLSTATNLVDAVLADANGLLSGVNV